MLHLSSRSEDRPGDGMVTNPRKLPDLSNDERDQIYEKIFDDGKDLNPGMSVYDNVYKVFLHQFLIDF